MSLETFLTDLDAARDRFATALTNKGISIPSNPTIIQCIIALQNWQGGGGSSSEPSSSESESSESSSSGESNFYPSGWTRQVVSLDCPQPRYFAGNPNNFNIETYEWSDDDALTVQLRLGSVYGTLVSTTVKTFDGIELGGNNFYYTCYPNRIGVGVQGGVNMSNLYYVFKRGGTTVDSGFLTGMSHPRYFTRPSGLGTWQLKINGSVVDAEYWTGGPNTSSGSWVDFPSDGLSNTYAGYYIRAKVQPTYPALACWSNNGVDGDPFFYVL